MSSTSLYDTIKSTTKAFISSYKEAKADISALSFTLTPDCERFLAPAAFLKSIGMPSLVSQSTSDYEKRMGPEMGLLEDSRVVIKSLTVDIQQRESVVWTDHFLTLRGREEVNLEFMHVLYFNENGDKIKIIEFIDTAEYMKYLTAMQETGKELSE